MNHNHPIMACVTIVTRFTRAVVHFVPKHVLTGTKRMNVQPVVRKDVSALVAFLETGRTSVF